MDHFAYDVVIVGSGATGLRAAISVREQGLSALVISKGPPGKSSCSWLSAGVMAGSANSKTRQAHLSRTVMSGRGINQPELVDILIEEAPVRLKELVAWGIHGELQTGGYLFAQGHAPVQGSEIVRLLLRKNHRLDTQFMGGMLVTDLVMDQGVGGICALNLPSGEWILISAKAVILAAGGAAALYARHDNPKRMIGDGYRLALEAGAILQDMEFVQFYPLCLHGSGAPPIVVPPKLADQGRLINVSGENILDKYGIVERPAAERARDRLSQALFQEIYREQQEVLLDLRGLSPEQWRIEPFSASMEHLLGDVYGGKTRPIPVAPVAHHIMGGVKISGAGATSVPGLFAAGETSGGLHGANRMGGNALSETLVFGARAGHSAADWARRQARVPGDSLPRNLYADKVSKRSGMVNVDHLHAELRNVMWDYAGVIRAGEGLMRAAESVERIREEATKALSWSDGDTAHVHELRSAVGVASLIIQGALRRQESRGAHFREDFPEQDDDNWCGRLQVRIKDQEDVWTFEPR